MIVRRIEEGIAKGLLPSDTRPAVVADLTLAVTQGMSVLARESADRDRLLAVSETANNGWKIRKP